jgi:hypothetical protein
MRGDCHWEQSNRINFLDLRHLKYQRYKNSHNLCLILLGWLYQDEISRVCSKTGKKQKRLHATSQTPERAASMDQRLQMTCGSDDICKHLGLLCGNFHCIITKELHMYQKLVQDGICRCWMTSKRKFVSLFACHIIKTMAESSNHYTWHLDTSVYSREKNQNNASMLTYHHQRNSGQDN